MRSLRTGNWLPRLLLMAFVAVAHASGTGAEVEEGGGHGDNSDFALDATSGGLFLFLVLLVGVTVRGLNRFVPLPYTVMLLCLGIGIGALEHGAGIIAFGHSIRVWAAMDPHLILFVFLPTLIFSGAFSVDFHAFRRLLTSILILAIPGIVVAVVLTAVFAIYAFDYNWDWPTALTFGAMLSATDPVAVVALMKEMGVPKALSLIVEGESLLNDGTAMVIFSVFKDSMTGGSTTVGGIIGLTARLSLGGSAIGIVVGLVMIYFLSSSRWDSVTQITITIITCYLVFFVAEATPIKVSGVLAVVMLGITMAANGRTAVRDHESMHVFWEMLEYLANTLIFVLAGVIIFEHGFADGIIRGVDWGYTVALFVVLNVIRFVMIGLFLPCLRRFGYGMNMSAYTVVSYGGLRGALGLVLALLVKADPAIDETVGSRFLFHMAATAVFTLLINGTSFAYILDRLGIAAPSPAKARLFSNAVTQVRQVYLDGKRRARRDEFLQLADWRRVEAFMDHIFDKLDEETESYIQRATEGVAKNQQQEEAGLAVLLPSWSDVVDWATCKRDGGAGGCLARVFGCAENKGRAAALRRGRLAAQDRAKALNDSSSAEGQTLDEAEQATTPNSSTTPGEAGGVEMVEVTVESLPSPDVRAGSAGSAGAGALVSPPRKPDSAAVSAAASAAASAAVAAALAASTHRSPVLKPEASHASADAGRHPTAIHIPSVDMPPSASSSAKASPTKISSTSASTSASASAVAAPASAVAAPAHAMHAAASFSFFPVAGASGSAHDSLSAKIPKQRFGSPARDGSAGLVEREPLSPLELVALSSSPIVIELRYRFLNVVKHRYWEAFSEGGLSAEAFTVLTEAADWCQDSVGSPMNEWFHIERFLGQSSVLSMVRKMVGLGCTRWSNWVDFNTISFEYDVASGFLRAHSQVLSELKHVAKDDDALEVVQFETNAQLKSARERLEDSMSLMEVTRAVQTRRAILFLLRKQEDRARDLMHEGAIDAREFESIRAALLTAWDSADLGPQIEVSEREVMREVGFLRLLKDADFNFIADISEHLLFERGDVLVHQGARTGGAFIILSGAIDVHYKRSADAQALVTEAHMTIKAKKRESQSIDEILRSISHTSLAGSVATHPVVDQPHHAPLMRHLSAREQHATALFPSEVVELVVADEARSPSAEGGRLPPKLALAAASFSSATAARPVTPKTPAAAPTPIVVPTNIGQPGGPSYEDVFGTAVDQLSRGGVLGVLSMLTGQPTTVTAVCKTRCRVVYLRQERIFPLLKSRKESERAAFRSVQSLEDTLCRMAGILAAETSIRRFSKFSREQIYDILASAHLCRPEPKRPVRLEGDIILLTGTLLRPKDFFRGLYIATHAPCYVPGGVFGFPASGPAPSPLAGSPTGAAIFSVHHPRPATTLEVNEEGPTVTDADRPGLLAGTTTPELSALPAWSSPSIVTTDPECVPEVETLAASCATWAEFRDAMRARGIADVSETLEDASESSDEATQTARSSSPLMGPPSPTASAAATAAAAGAAAAATGATSAAGTEGFSTEYHSKARSTMREVTLSLGSESVTLRDSDFESLTEAYAFIENDPSAIRWFSWGTRLLVVPPGVIDAVERAEERRMREAMTRERFGDAATESFAPIGARKGEAKARDAPTRGRAGTSDGVEEAKGETWFHQLTMARKDGERMRKAVAEGSSLGRNPAGRAASTIANVGRSRPEPVRGAAALTSMFDAPSSSSGKDH